MPSWKKVILSGSDAALNSLTVSNGITGSLFGTASWSSNAQTATLATNVVGTTNRILFNNATNTTTTSNNLTWTDSTNLLTLGDGTGTAGTISKLALYTSSFGGYGLGVSPAQLDYVSDGSHVFYKNGSTPAELVRITNTGNVIITGSAAIGTSSLGPSENSLTLGARDGASEGGQIGFNAPGGTYTSASFIDNWQNKARILKGNNTTSTGLIAQWDIHTTQMQLAGYTAASSFPGTATANLAVDSGGNVITVSTSGGSVFPYTGTAGVTGSISATGPIYSQVNGGMYFQGGDDAALHDINVSNTMGVYGVQNSTVGAIKLGSNGPVLYGSGSSLGIGTTTPNSGALHVNGGVFATSFTGSLLGTASFAVSSSYAATASFLNSTTNAFIQNGNSFGALALLGTNDNQSLALETNGSTRMFLSSSGDVGIGNTTPTARLDVNGNTTVTGSLNIVNTFPFIRLRNSGSGATGNIAIVAVDDTFASKTAGTQIFAIQPTNTGGTSVGGIVYTKAASNSTNTSFTYDSTNTSAIFISGSSNVGIRTNTPNSASLHVSGNVWATSYTGSLLGTASFAVSSSRAVTSSFALTSSYASNGGVTQLLAGPNITLAPTNGLGQVTISSTSGGGGFNTATGSYGSFYDTTTQTNPVGNIPRSMSLDTTDITNGVSVSGSTNPFNTYIKTENAGVYDIQFSAQVEKTDSGTDEIVIWLRKNGTDLTDTATTITLSGNNDKQVAAWNWFVNSAANDYYQIIWISADTGMRLLAEPISGTHPGIPSVIVTANRVDQFLSNTGSFSGSFTGQFTGSLFGTSSWASNAVTASNALSSSNFVVTNTLALDAALVDYASVNPTVSGLNTIYTQATGSFTSAFMKYTVSSGSNTRAGEFMTAWNGTNTVYTDTSTTDIGTTAGISFISSIVSSQLIVSASCTTAGWNVKTLSTFI